MRDCYDRSGEAITSARWALLFEDKRYQVVKQSNVGPVLISTVWLGIDHSFGHGPPQIFETMTFGSEDEEQYRYASEAEALEHHAELVAQFSLLASVDA